MSGEAAEFPVPGRLQLPVEQYKVEGYKFGERVRSRVILWARHLGEDVLAPPGTEIKAAGEGRVVWSEIRRGAKNKPNWGGIVIIGHKHKDTGEVFYTLYGHLTNLAAAVGDEVTVGQKIGVIAAGSTPDNGWWKLPHLHFSIYFGPWTNQVPPGYSRFFEGRTKFSWWRKPSQFITEYNALPLNLE